MFEDFDPKLASQKIIDFLKRELYSAGFQRVIIPLSGGIDSSTVVCLAAKALGKENVLIVRLPYKNFNHDNDAELMISQLKIPPANVFEIDISKIVSAFLRDLGRLDNLRLGNIMARARMVILYDLAKKNQALVCGTENKSEYLLGYFTRFGDQASDLEPIRNLYKTQVIKLAGYFSLPKEIITKPPTAGLWSGQTDEKELGFSYEEADPVLYQYFDKKLPWEKISQLDFKSELVEKVKNQVEKNKFKHGVPKVAIA